MRILWYSQGAPWCNTGYGRQTALFVPRLAALGHEMAIAVDYGLAGGPLTWQGFPVFPGGQDPWGPYGIAGHYRQSGADLLIALMDVWAAAPYPLADAGMAGAFWTPVDCDPAGRPDREALAASGAVPVAMSRFGEARLREAGFSPLYVPHAVDTTVFAPPADRDQLRRDWDLDGRFVIGINAANNDKSRKGFPEQFTAFARFRRTHPDARLLVHAAAVNEPLGLDLIALARAKGIWDWVRFTDQYAYASGLVDDAAMAQWYGVLDVLSACSWAEGCGIPLIEAQACGVPVVTTRAASMTELAGPGWLAGGEPFWNYRHEANWVKPDIEEITRAYSQAFLDARNRRGRARQFAEGYDVKRVTREYWVPALASIATRPPPRPRGAGTATGSPG